MVNAASCGDKITLQLQKRYMRKISANEDVMTTREAGERLGVAVRTVQLWVEAGVLPAWRTAGGIGALRAVPWRN